jgi:CheY-like chemotaxis protein
VSTRILFADDSVTAQNMGKRILTEAGYEVVAVSNGAAAVKKIAEQKPDIIILDLYMPGYSGLEVCEKVRGSMATLKTPVLLTVGKMEPYRPEDANRVRADGVIVKPFEASDLLAIIKKFEERIAPPPPPLAPPPAAAEPEQAMAEFEELPTEVSQSVASSSQSVLDVPDHMASSAAFPDMLGMESVEASPVSAQPAAAFESSVKSEPSRAGVPEYELPISWRNEEQTSKTEIELPASPASASEPPQHDVQVFETGNAQAGPARDSTDVAPPPAPSHPLQIPVYQEPAGPEAAAAPEMMPTAAPALGEIEIPRDPYLEEGALEATRNTVATSTEPGLVSSLQEEPVELPQAAPEATKTVSSGSEFSTAQSQEIPADVLLEVAPEAAQASIGRQQAPPSDMDFEARVAAALAEYSQTETMFQSPESAPAAQETQPSEALSDAAEQPASLNVETGVVEQSVQSTPVEPEHIVSTKPDQAIPAFEYHPPVGASFPEANAEPSPITSGAAGHDVVRELEPITAQETTSREGAHAQEAFAAVVHSDQNAVVEAAPLAPPSSVAAAPADPQADRDMIAHAVYRVMERLKPELVEEILRELKSKE